VVIVADRAFGLQSFDKGQLVGITDDRHIDLRECGINGAVAIFDEVGNLRGARVVVVLVILVEIGVVIVYAADRHFQVAAGKRQNAAIRGGAIFMDQHFLAVIAETGNETDGRRAVAGELCGIAEQVQIRNVGRFREAGERAARRNGPTECGADLPRIDQTALDRRFLVIGYYSENLAGPVERQIDVESAVEALREFATTDVYRRLKSKVIADANVVGRARWVKRVEGGH